MIIKNYSLGVLPFYFRRKEGTNGCKCVQFILSKSRLSIYSSLKISDFHLLGRTLMYTREFLQTGQIGLIFQWWHALCKGSSISFVIFIYFDIIFLISISITIVFFSFLLPRCSIYGGWWLSLGRLFFTVYQPFRLLYKARKDILKLFRVIMI